MRKNHATIQLDTQGSINIENWLNHFLQKHHYHDLTILRQACILAQLTGRERATPNGQSCLHQGLTMAEILAELELDQETLAAAVVYSCVRYADLSIEDATESLGGRVARLIHGVKEMDALHNLHEYHTKSHQHETIDNLRKMLLAMVGDVRVVLIKLAEKLCILRNMPLFSLEEKKREAKEVMDVYAPLANRLGIGNLKWQLEDLSFRYLEPEIYKKISASLNEKREEREHYVQTVIKILEDALHQLGIQQLEVTGRAKHIYSIYRKMLRKKVDINEIYDVTAFRILVQTIEDCYTVLGYVHSMWKHIPKEFDDYIAQPKANGYRSIHTAVIGPNGKHIEIQTRTFAMHQESELGVAAHWVYKEGAKTGKAGYEAKIAWLRQVMDWQKEVSEHESQKEELIAQAFNDRVYVFTPNGDIIDLPKGATPLDFAYHIHSEIGNRCRGAKINGQIVNLTYALNTGEYVEILTTKQGQPSRDWLNPHIGYLKTARAKAKVHNWFRKQDYDQNLAEGRDLFEKELKRLGLKNIDQTDLAHQLHFKSSDDMYAALGRGDLHSNTLMHIIQPQAEPKITITATEHATPGIKAKTSPAVAAEINVEGIGNLLMHIALCCKPVPKDAIIGYVTQISGVSIHRQDCPNILHISAKKHERLINVNWGEQTKEKYPVDLAVDAYDRPGLVRDITNLLASENISIVGLNCVTNKKDHTAHITLTIEIHSLNPLSKILTHIHQLQNIIEVRRLG